MLLPLLLDDDDDKGDLGDLILTISCSVFCANAKDLPKAEVSKGCAFLLAHTRSQYLGQMDHNRHNDTDVDLVRLFTT